MVLGNASNIIVRDGGIPGFVIMFDRLRDISVDGYVIEAEADLNSSTPLMWHCTIV